MRKSLGKALFIGIISLFIVGIIAMLMQNPSQLVKNIFATLLIVGIITGAFFLFLRSKRSLEEKKYAQALRKNKKNKQSKPTSASSFTAEKHTIPIKKKNILPLRKGRKSDHLYVIEGKKSKKKA